MTSILAYTRQVTGAKLLSKRKMQISAPKTAKAGQSFSVTVKADRLPYVNEGHGTRKRVFIALVNGADSSVQLQEALNADPSVSKSFQVVSEGSGSVSLKAYVVSGDGQIEKAKSEAQVTIE